MFLNQLVAAPWWFWLVGGLAAVSIGAVIVLVRRTAAQEETIRRQLARESALRARFDDLFDRSSEIIIVHDHRGRVSTINRSGEAAIGYGRDELRVLDPNWIFDADYLTAINQLIGEGAGGQPRAFRSEFVPRKGNRVPVEVRVNVLIGEGEVVGVSSIARDLTERDRLENELRQAQKMEAVGHLATGIAHDFNNLITVLLGYSDELIEQAARDTTIYSAAIEVRRVADRASALTQQLLAFSRRQTTVAQSVDLNQIIAHMEDLVRRLIGSEIRLTFSLQPDLGMISADSQQLGQVVMNLIVNARDAMPNGGTLMIETANVVLGDEVADAMRGPHVALTVSDSGLGTTPEIRERRSEPYLTTKESGSGTGLGLSMAQALVRQTGGHVVERSSGEGAVFTVYFPRHADRESAPLPPLTPPAGARIKGEGVVLLAEDDRSVRKLVVKELTRRGFTVLDAEDGAAALELFEREKDRVDVLVTDVVMPRLNGADLAKAAESLRPGLKILFISGHPERAGAGLEPTGVTNLLMKPFTADTLAARIKELITGKKEVDGWGV